MTSPGPLWREVDARPRLTFAGLAKVDIPNGPGVYAIYCKSRRAYVGKAGSLRDRIWGSHNSRSRSMGRSAFRRNVAQHLGVASAHEIKTKQYRCTAEELERIRDWIERCEIAWIERPTDDAAIAAEAAIKLELMPPLTKT